MSEVLLVLLLTVAPRAQAIDFGCYVNVYECGGMEAWPETVKRMRSAGLTTAVIWTYNAEDLTLEIDTMIEGGMLANRPPLLVIVETNYRRPPDEPLVVFPAPGGWGTGEMEGQADVLSMARAAAKHPDQWPDLLIYGPDEPGHGDPNADLSGLAKVRDGYAKVGVRVGGSVECANILGALPYYEVIAMASEDGYATARDVKALHEAGRGFWVYDSALLNRKPWTLGVQMCRWCAWNPDCYLFWSWQALMAQPPGYQDQWLWAFREAAEEINRVQDHILPGVPR